ncbi:hypothetical protein BCR35DRAFT_308315 [Leucosporidium creatinivorum]|uniref:Dolichyl-diphosphooligosaccharide-protein glycosyltransferase subunit OST5 n=1 Tax=Leucosporidium creatinivorum TaxID=106004 RepID=A0A1Y2E9F8_9BASI|nr:hypothetical protein BCR35DRAFT_308315 [Leucosporidium creatinivorum]
MSTYAELLAEHNSLPAFAPFLPSSSLQPLAITFLSLAFVLSFYFSTLRAKGLPTQELAVGSLASVLGGFGLVFAFCAVGVNV